MAEPSDTLGPDYLDVHKDVPVKLTISVGNAVLVDVADDGRVVGVECLTGPVDAGVLHDVLMKVKWRLPGA